MNISKHIIITMVVIIIAVIFAEEASSKETSGIAHVIDGDTIVINKQKFRFFGVDAFESNQQCKDGEGNTYLCGNKSANFLYSLINDKTVTCTHKGKSWDRIVAICRVGQIDLARELVREGHALAWKKYSHLYLDDMAYAKKLQKGAWKGTFEEPWVYRKK